MLQFFILIKYKILLTILFYCGRIRKTTDVECVFLGGTDMKNISIGDAELEIMKVVWKAMEPITSLDIGKEVEDKGWKKTTIATFLARHVEKGALSADKQGKLYYYTPLITEKEYRKSQTKNLIKTLYNGSVRDFAVSFFEEQKLSEDDIKELKAIFEDKEE